METEVNPNAIVAEFINQYDYMIKPGLKNGNIVGANSTIGLVCMKLPIVEEKMISLKKGAYARYRMALTYLEGFLEKRKVSKKTVEDILMYTDRQINELKFIMQGDSNYEGNIKSKQLN